MSPIETVVCPVRDRITVRVPREYASYSFQVILIPLPPKDEKVRTVAKIPGLEFKIKDEDLFSDDAESWEAYAKDVPVA